MLKELDFKDELIKEKIKQFQKNSNFTEYTQTIEWYNVRDEQKYFLYSENYEGKIEWTCILLVKSSKNKNEKFLYANRGPVLNYNSTIVINNFFKEIKRWMNEHQYFKLIMNPYINSKMLNNFPKDINYKIASKENYSEMLDAYILARIDIYGKEEEMLSKMGSEIRRNTRKAEKKGLQCKISNKVDFQNFYRLYIETSIRHGFKAHDIEYFKRLYNNYKENIVFIEIWNKDIPIAAGLDIIYKGRLIYLYGASSTEYRKLLGMYKMHWESIKYCINNGIKQYDLGGVFCTKDDKESKDYGLYRLKKGYCNYNGFIENIPDIAINM